MTNSSPYMYIVLPARKQHRRVSPRSKHYIEVCWVHYIIYFYHISNTEQKKYSKENNVSSILISIIEFLSLIYNILTPKAYLAYLCINFRIYTKLFY